MQDCSFSIAKALEILQGPYSLNGKMSYIQTSWLLIDGRLGFIMIVSFWNFTGTSAVLPSNGLSNFRVISKVKTRISQLKELNSLGPSDAIWRWRSWSTLVQVMACCLTAPSHYLNQCWLIISKVLWHSSEDIIIRRYQSVKQDWRLHF